MNKTSNESKTRWLAKVTQVEGVVLEWWVTSDGIALPAESPAVQRSIVEYFYND